MPEERYLNNWLRTYVDTWTLHQEPPELFHLWVGVSVLATALGRKVSFDRGHYILYPNFYTILIAGSGKCRKSTALREGAKMLKELEDADRIKIIRNKITPERLIESLGTMAQVELPETSEEFVARGSEALIYAPELTTLIDGQSYKNGLITILTDLYDCHDKWHNETKHAGFNYLYNVYLNILGATIPSELSEVVPIQSIGSGFTSRIMLIYQRTTNRRVPNPEDFYRTPEMVELKEKLLADLRHIHKLSGKFHWGKGAKDLFTQWYMGMQEQEDAKMDGYASRKHDHAIKLAMILSASIKDDLIVEKEQLISAISLLDQVEVYLAGIYQILTSTGGSTEAIRAVLRHMIKCGGSANHSDLQRKCWRMFKTADEFKNVIQMMLDAGMITRLPAGTYGKTFYAIINDEDIREILDG